jgi:hypothetical protein
VWKSKFMWCSLGSMLYPRWIPCDVERERERGISMKQQACKRVHSEWASEGIKTCEGIAVRKDQKQLKKLAIELFQDPFCLVEWKHPWTRHSDMVTESILSLWKSSLTIYIPAKIKYLEYSEHLWWPVSKCFKKKKQGLWPGPWP